MSDVDKTQTGTVTLANGVAEVRYKIKSPKVNQAAKLTCSVADPMNLRKDDNVDLSTLPNGRPIDQAPSTYTISASKSGNVVTFTVKCSLITSTIPMNLRITEYRPGNPIGVIRTQDVVVTMVSGTGTSRYTISQTQPTVDQKVEGKLIDLPAVRTEVTVPKYVAPPTEPTGPPLSGRVSVSMSGGGGRTGSFSGTVSVSANYPGPYTVDISGVQNSIKGKTGNGNVSVSPSSVVLRSGGSASFSGSYRENSYPEEGTVSVFAGASGLTYGSASVSYRAR